MSNLVYIWLATGIFFFLIEMFTATFYGLSISIAGFVLAVYVYLTGDVTITVVQGVILAVVSAVFAYALPKWLKPSHTEEFKSGVDAHIGKKFHLEKVGSDWKIKIDGVDFLINEDCITSDFEAGARVVIVSHKGGVLTVLLAK